MVRWSFFALLTLLVTARAHAWTDAHVREVDVDLVVGGEGRTQVTLTLGVEVQGGWLERLDLPGIDDELDPEAPPAAWLVLPDGSKQPAGVKLKHGELSVRFEKAQAPRRGLHRIAVQYETVLLGRASESLGDGMVRLRYALPGWEAGLTRGELRWHLPAGARAVEDGSIAQQVVQEAGVVRFTRVHVPRTTPWAVAVDVPEQALGAVSAAPRGAHARQGRSPVTGAWLTAVLCAVAWLARALARRTGRRDGYEGLPLGRTGLRRAVRLACALGAALAWPLTLVGSTLLLVLLAVSFADRFAPSAQAPGLGRFTPLTRAELARTVRGSWLAHLGLAPVLDATTLLGALGVLAGVVAVARRPAALDLADDPWGLGLACALVPLFTAARWRRPRAVTEQVALLAESARKLVTVGSALRLVWYVGEAAPREPRLRFLPFARYPGLLRVELAIDTRRFATPRVLMVVVEADSSADRWLAEAGFAPHRELSAGARRALHLVPVAEDAELSEVVDDLFARLSQSSQQRWDEAAAAA
jgi:hypothetical protein